MCGNDGVTIIIPAKNEEKTLPQIIGSIRPYADEILVVDGHSMDDTRKIAHRLGCKVLLDNGKGKGDALRVGINNATKDILVFFDADGSHIAEDIPRLLSPLREDEVDLVIASRMTGGSEELHGDFSKFVRLIGSILITLTINYRCNVRLTDSQNGFRAIKREVARNLRLKADRYDIETEMTMKALKKGYRVAEVPSRELRRKSGKSGINLWKMWYWYLWRVLTNLF